MMPRASFLTRLCHDAAQQFKKVRRSEDSDEFSTIHDRQGANLSPTHETRGVFDLGLRSNDSDSKAHDLRNRSVQSKVSHEQAGKIAVRYDPDDLTLSDDNEVPELAKAHPFQGFLGRAVLADCFHPLSHQLFDSHRASRLFSKGDSECVSKVFEYTGNSIRKGARGMRLEEVMNKKVETVDAGMSAEQAWNRLTQSRIHHLVVTRGSEIVGILSDRDMGGFADPEYRKNRTVADVMTSSVVTARKETTLREAANLMRGRSIGSLPVVENGKLVGIVTTTDLLTLIGKGAERPVTKSKRWIMKGRGPRRKSGSPR